MRFFLKWLIFVLILSLFLTVFPSCGKNEISAYDVLSAALSSLDKESALHGTVYTYSAGEFSKNRMSKRLISALYYGGRESDMWEFSLFSDYAVMLPFDDVEFECHVFKVRYKSDVDTSVKFLERRLKLLRQGANYLYDPENYEKYILSSGVYTYRNFVMLLCMPDNDAAMRNIEKLF